MSIYGATHVSKANCAVFFGTKVRFIQEQIWLLDDKTRRYLSLTFSFDISGGSAPIVFDEKKVSLGKGTVLRDFLIPIFFIKGVTLVAVDMPGSNFQLHQIVVELFIFEIFNNRLTTVNDSRDSKIES